MADDGNSGEQKTERFNMFMAPSEMKAIDDWAWRNRVRSKSEAVRRLCQMGLVLDGRVDDLVSVSKAVIAALDDLDTEQVSRTLQSDDVSLLREGMVDLLKSLGPVLATQQTVLDVLEGLITPAMNMRLQAIEKPFDEAVAIVQGIQLEAERLVSEYDDRKDRP